MKKLLTKILFIVFLVFGFSSFIFLKNTEKKQEVTETANVRFDNEMDAGFAERESRF